MILTNYHKIATLSMLIRPLPIITGFINNLNESLQTLNPSSQLSFIQRAWLGTVLMGIIVTGMLNWAAFERRSLGTYSQSRLRWMFRLAKINWNLLLFASVQYIFLKVSPNIFISSLIPVK